MRGLRICRYYYSIAFFLCIVDFITASNWAQTVGIKAQNNAEVPKQFFSPRHGHAITKVELTDEEKYISAGAESMLFVLGGDSMDVDVGGGGYKNDVWISKGPFVGDFEWLNLESKTERDRFGLFKARTLAMMVWEEVNSGAVPPKGVEYSDWIKCKLPSEFSDIPRDCDDAQSEFGRYKNDAMWSPRRNHAVLYVKNEEMAGLYVFGGRAREIRDLSPYSTIGGVIGPRVQNEWREKTTLRNDIWRSTDFGKSWELMTPGCRGGKTSQDGEVPYSQTAPQLGEQRVNNPYEGRSGEALLACSSDSDCYDTETCYPAPKDSRAPARPRTCVCRFWQGREGHAVMEYAGTIFVFGGVISVLLQACGAYACNDAGGGNYGKYMNDVWQSASADMQTWDKVADSGDRWSGREGHRMAFLNGRLWLVGGRAGGTYDIGFEFSVNGQEVSGWYNDVWSSANGKDWVREAALADWAPRSRFVLGALEPPLFGGAPTDKGRLIIMGGEAEDGTILGDTWTWDLNPLNPWVLDTSAGTPTGDYIDLDGSPALLRVFSEADLAALTAVGVNSVRELAAANVYTIVRLRGFGYPEQEVFHVPRICDYFRMAQDMVAKCSVQKQLYDGEEDMYFNVIHRMEWPMGTPSWVEAYVAPDPVLNWDGCTYIPTEISPDVNGLGPVEQVPEIHDMWRQIDELHCLWRPVARAGHAGIVFNNALFVVGGESDPVPEDSLMAEIGAPPDTVRLLGDTWYRDEVKPHARIKKKPKSGSTFSVFNFDADKPGCLFEYMVIDMKENLIVRSWTASLGHISVKRFMPYEGKFQLRVRAVDPAGNRDAPLWKEGENQHTWTWVPELPVGLIVGLCFLTLAIGGGTMLELRRRRKLAEMERYALKRMRRKFKGVQKTGNKDDVDWKGMYGESKMNHGSVKKKSGGGGKGKKKTQEEVAAEAEKKKRRKGKKTDGKGGGKKDGEDSKKKGTGKSGDKTKKRRKKKKSEGDDKGKEGGSKGKGKSLDDGDNLKKGEKKKKKKSSGSKDDSDKKSKVGKKGKDGASKSKSEKKGKKSSSSKKGGSSEKKGTKKEKKKDK